MGGGIRKDLTTRLVNGLTKGFTKELTKVFAAGLTKGFTIIYFELYPHPDFFKICIFDAFLFPRLGFPGPGTMGRSKQSIDRSINRSKINEPIDRSIDQSITQSFNQSIDRSIE